MSQRRRKLPSDDDVEDWDDGDPDMNKLMNRHLMSHLAHVLTVAGIIVVIVIAGINQHKLNDLNDKVKNLQEFDEALMAELQANHTNILDLLHQILDGVTVPVLLRSEHGVPLGVAFGDYVARYTTDNTFTNCDTDPQTYTVGCVLYEEHLQR